MRSEGVSGPLPPGWVEPWPTQCWEGFWWPAQHWARAVLPRSAAQTQARELKPKRFHQPSLWEISWQGKLPTINPTRKRERWRIQTDSVQFSHSVASDSLWPHGLQHARPPCPSPTPEVYSNSWTFSQLDDAIQPSHSLLSPSPPAFNLSQHQGLSQGVSSSHQVAKVSNRLAYWKFTLLAA